MDQSQSQHAAPSPSRWTAEKPTVTSARPRTVAIVQARMGSTRLPGKVLADIAGKPMLVRVVERLRRAATIDEIVIATTTATADDVLVDFCARRGYTYYAGSEHDVLGRYYHASLHLAAEVIVRVTADCPLIDPLVVDRTVKAFHAAAPEIDYASNVLPPRSFPRGLDVEVFSATALARVETLDRDPASREHVTPHFYRHPESFRLLRVPADFDASEHRWTVDTPEDLELARRIHSHFGDGVFNWMQALESVRQHPEWSALNRHVVQRAA